MLSRRILFLFAATLPPATSTLLAQATRDAPVAVAENLTEAQHIAFNELEADFARLEVLLATLPDSQPKLETKRVLEVMKVRAAGLRKNFDQTRFDETRYEANYEHQQLLLWLQPPRLVPPGSEAEAARFNTLTALEKSSGWELLFDGKTLAGWRGYRLKGLPPAGWEVQNGTLHNAGGAENGVDLVTERTFANFELMWEWRVAPGANSGVKYFVREDRPAAPGHEYQLLDDDGDPARARRTVAQRTAAFYDVVPPAADKPLRKAGEWNHSRVVVSGDRVEHWLNGRNVLTYHLGSPDVRKGIAQSKFKSERGFGEKVPGPFLITYHASQAWFRNIKVRELK